MEHFCAKCEWGDFPERCKDSEEHDFEAEERQFLKDVYKGTIFGEGKDNCCPKEDIKI